MIAPQRISLAATAACLIFFGCAAERTPAEVTPPPKDTSSAELAAAERSFAEGRLDEARAQLAAAVEELASSRGTGVETELLASARLATRLGELRSGIRAWERVLADREAAPRPELRAVEGARLELANLLADLPDLPRAQALYEESLRALQDRVPEDDELVLRAKTGIGTAVWRRGDPARARPFFDEVLAVRERASDPDSRELQDARLNVGCTLYASGDLEGALALLQQAHDVFARTVDEDDLRFQYAREMLATVLRATGNSAGERALLEKVLASRSRTLPEEHPDLQRARMNLATVLQSEGDAQAALLLLERAHAVLERTVPADDRNLQLARMNLARALDGDLPRAKVLCSKAVDSLSRTMPEDHHELQSARLALARICSRLGETEEAIAQAERALAALSRTLPAHHARVLAARRSLGVFLRDAGRLPEARELFAQGLRDAASSLPADNREVQDLQIALAAVMADQGDLQGARVLEERVLESREKTLPPGSRDLAVSRLNLGVTLRESGDLDRARALLEQAVESLSLSHPDEAYELQAARLNLAAVLTGIGDLGSALPLQEKVVEVLEATRPDDDLRLQVARQSLAGTLNAMGEVDRARAIYESVLAVRERKLPDGHPELEQARGNLAEILERTGDLGGARELQEQVLARMAAVFPASHPSLEVARRNLAWTLRRIGDEPALAACLHDLAEALHARIEAAVLALSPREGESVASAAGGGISTLLSLLPENDGGREAFALVESARSVAIVSHRLARRIEEEAADGKWEGLRDRVRAASLALARVGASAESAAELTAAVARKEQAERELREALDASRIGSSLLPESGAEAVGARLAEGEVAVGYWRYARELRSDQAQGPIRNVPSLLAFVVEPGGALRRVELGPAAAIEEAVERWRATMTAEGARDDVRGVATAGPGTRVSEGWEAAGRRVRELVLDPLGPAVLRAKRVLVALDDVLHLAPLDALPMPEAEGGGVAADRIAFVFRPTLVELPEAERAEETGGTLLVLGGLDYGSAGGDPEARGDGFVALPGTAREIEAVARAFESSSGPAAVVRSLTGAEGTKAALLAGAPGARFVHLATHGYFDPAGSSGGAAVRERAAGLSPMLLCGLALSGADAGPDETGELRGRITGEEIASLDLRRCELAVLSACDTSAGLRRAGQGVASLQTALHAAGARSAITSLWKVSDEAAVELMSDFYGRLWSERKGAARALAEAKLRMRQRGVPPRDWAGWILSGETD